jgi:threonine/homoserine/homoserine lactone efflux protein
MNTALASLIFVAAITPGPNNFIVLQLALMQDWFAAARAIAGILFGGVIMLALAQVGVSALFEQLGVLRVVVLVTGCGYLVWLGCRMLRDSFRAQGDVAAAPPHGVLALSAFQFVNPKAWILIFTAAAAAQDSEAGRASLYAFFVLIPGVCLTAWAACGRWAHRLLRIPESRARLDRVLAVAMIVFAAWLPFH